MCSLCVLPHSRWKVQFVRQAFVYIKHFRIYVFIPRRLPEPRPCALFGVQTGKEARKLWATGAVFVVFLSLSFICCLSWCSDSCGNKEKFL